RFEDRGLSSLAEERITTNWDGRATAPPTDIPAAITGIPCLGRRFLLLQTRWPRHLRHPEGGSRENTLTATVVDNRALRRRSDPETIPLCSASARNRRAANSQREIALLSAGS